MYSVLIFVQTAQWRFRSNGSSFVRSITRNLHARWYTIAILAVWNKEDANTQRDPERTTSVEPVVACVAKCTRDLLYAGRDEIRKGVDLEKSSQGRRRLEREPGLYLYLLYEHNNPWQTYYATLPFRRGRSIQSNVNNEIKK